MWRVRVRGVGAGAAGLGCAKRVGNRRQEGGCGPRPGPGVRHRGGLGGVAHSIGIGRRGIGGIMRKRPGAQRRWNPPMCRGIRSAHGSPSSGNRRSSKNPGIARKSPNRPAREAPSNVQRRRTGREEPGSPSGSAAGEQHPRTGREEPDPPGSGVAGSLAAGGGGAGGGAGRPGSVGGLPRPARRRSSAGPHAPSSRVHATASPSFWPKRARRVPTARSRRSSSASVAVRVIMSAPPSRANSTMPAV